jgi:hypothetical protein
MTTDGRTFIDVNDAVLIALICTARDRIIFMAPGLRKEVALALIGALDRELNVDVTVILDVDSEVCRLGYGDMAGLKLVQSGVSGRFKLTHLRSN